MALIRCFIAIDLPGELKQELADLIAGFKKRTAPFVRWVDPMGIHLTLKFLGEVSEELVDEIRLVMQEVANNTPHFQLEIAGVGAFPSLVRPQLAWVGIQGEMDKLYVLQRRIDAKLEQLGFPREQRAYSPHLTLGRVRQEASDFERQKLGKILSNVTFTPTILVDVESVQLARSQLTTGGAIYSTIQIANLKPPLK